MPRAYDSPGATRPTRCRDRSARRPRGPRARRTSRRSCSSAWRAAGEGLRRPSRPPSRLAPTGSGRDPSDLLVGGARDAVAGHSSRDRSCGVRAVRAAAWEGRPPRWLAPARVGQLALARHAPRRHPWRDRRGRPPMEPHRVVAAVVRGAGGRRRARLMVIRPTPGPPPRRDVRAERARDDRGCGAGRRRGGRGGPRAPARTCGTGLDRGGGAGARVVRPHDRGIVRSREAERIVRTLLTWQALIADARRRIPRRVRPGQPPPPGHPDAARHATAPPR